MNVNLDSLRRLGDDLDPGVPDVAPDEAWETLEGDDRPTTKELRKRNRAEKKQLATSACCMS